MFPHECFTNRTPDHEKPLKAASWRLHSLTWCLVNYSLWKSSCDFLSCFCAAGQRGADEDFTAGESFPLHPRFSVICSFHPVSRRFIITPPPTTSKRRAALIGRLWSDHRGFPVSLSPSLRRRFIWSQSFGRKLNKPPVNYFTYCCLPTLRLENRRRLRGGVKPHRGECETRQRSRAAELSWSPAGSCDRCLFSESLAFSDQAAEFRSSRWWKLKNGLLNLPHKFDLWFPEAREATFATSDRMRNSNTKKNLNNLRIWGGWGSLCWNPASSVGRKAAVCLV